MLIPKAGHLLLQMMLLNHCIIITRLFFIIIFVPRLLLTSSMPRFFLSLKMLFPVHLHPCPLHLVLLHLLILLQLLRVLWWEPTQLSSLQLQLLHPYLITVREAWYPVRFQSFQGDPILLLQLYQLLQTTQSQLINGVALICQQRVHDMDPCLLRDQRHLRQQRMPLTVLWEKLQGQGQEEPWSGLRWRRNNIDIRLHLLDINCFIGRPNSS